MNRLFALTVTAGLLIATDAHADRRNFTWLYEPKTMAETEMELEYYMTTAVLHDRVSDTHEFNWAHQVELEYGITDRWDASMYQMFSESGWTGYKLRTRYRPFYTGELPVDLLGYFELIGLADGDIAFEERVVAGKTFGKLVVSLDSMLEQGPVTGDVGYKWIEALGIAYEVKPWISLGLESQARMFWEPKQVYGMTSPELEFAGTKLYTGPTVSFAGSKFWWDLNISFRAVGEHDDARYLGRVLWGVFL